jgi:hypothetical protein
MELPRATIISCALLPLKQPVVNTSQAPSAQIAMQATQSQSTQVDRRYWCWVQGMQQLDIPYAVALIAPARCRFRLMKLILEFMMRYAGCVQHTL